MTASKFLAALAAVMLVLVPAASPVLAQAPAMNPGLRPAAPIASVAPAAQGPVAPRPAGRLAPGEAIPPAELEAFVDGVVRDGMATDHVSGATVAVVQGGRTILLKGYGFATPDRAVDPNRDLFRIASVSKTFTWILLMREVEAGRMKLDAPINDYLPADMKIPDQGFKRPIRVVDLMGHGGGFEDTALGHLFTDDPAKVTSLKAYIQAHRPNRVREAGQFSTYCNWCVALVGYAVARSAGAPDFQTLAERDIFTPLGMSSTTFRGPYPARAGLPSPMPKALADRLSTGFAWDGSGYRPMKFEFGSLDPAGSVSTTAADMARYMLMQLNGGAWEGATIYGPTAAKAFRTQVFNEPRGVNGWAHGFQAMTMPGGYAAYGHGGALSNYFTNMMVIPELDLGIFISTNTNTGRPLIDRVPSHIVARFYAPASETLARPDPKLKEKAARYAGYYLGTRRSYTGLEGFVYLFNSGANVAVNDQGYLVVSAGGVARQYVPDGRQDGFVTTDGRNRLTFNVEKDRAVSFRAGSGTQTFERARWMHDPNLMNILLSLALIAAFAAIIGAFTRIGRDVRPTPAQAWSNIGYLAASAAWLGSAGMLLVWAQAAGGYDNSYFYNWPGPMIVGGSALALIAALITAALVVLLPFAWMPQRSSTGGWTLWRKLRQTVGVVVFAAFALLMLNLGALQPWAA